MFGHKKNPIDHLPSDIRDVVKTMHLDDYKSHSFVINSDDSDNAVNMDVKLEPQEGGAVKLTFDLDPVNDDGLAQEFKAQEWICKDGEVASVKQTSIASKEDGRGLSTVVAYDRATYHAKDERNSSENITGDYANIFLELALTAKERAPRNKI